MNLPATKLEPAVKHTPGPWRVAEQLTGNDRVRPWIESAAKPYDSNGYKGFRTIAHIEGSTLGDTEANARLIAAAPEMLSSLELLCDACDLFVHDEEMAISLAPAYEAARELIRKAKGEL